MSVNYANQSASVAYHPEVIPFEKVQEATKSIGYKLITGKSQEQYHVAEEAASNTDGMTSTFCQMILHTGCRISEALNLKVRHIDFEAGAVIFETLKQRKKGVFRQVPLSDHFLRTMNQVHDLKKRQVKRSAGNDFIWTSPWLGKPKLWSRKTAYAKVMEVMDLAGLKGTHATPKGLRHAFAIACLDKGIPLNMVQKWMGHTSITTTAIYANATGEEERSIAARLWA